MKVISVESVSKKFILAHDRPKDLADAARGIFRRRKNEDFWALKDVSFDVEQGEALGIIGHNGAGKSTMLKLLTRIMEPTSGRIRTRGRVSALIEVGAGFHPEMTGRENIYLNGSILGMSHAEIHSKLDDIISFAELERFIDTPVKRYSSGMYARLGFAVAAHVDPEILIVDEVLAVGDLEFQQKCLQRMQEVRTSSGRTVIFVSHNLAAVRSLCTTGICIKAGSIISGGPVDTVVKDYLDTLERDCEIGLAETTERSGTGSMRLTDVRLLDGNGCATNALIAGEPTTVKMSYVNPGGVKRANFIFTVYNQTGVPVTNIDMGLTAFSPGPLQESGDFYCTIPELPLPTGRYRVAASIVVGGENADHVNSATVFDVVGSRYFEGGKMPPSRYCTALVAHSWSSEPVVAAELPFAAGVLERPGEHDGPGGATWN